MVKLSCAKSKMLVAAVLISLSGFTSTIEAHKCYWCGPLADQVHRSRRSQPCNSSAYEETICDPGYDHCAVIATSPPLTKSRVCVKIYQDECYSVYCNSSRHWRVVCPCRGELCNGLATQRESEAFTTLFQKTKRSIFGTMKIRPKRDLVDSSKFISGRRIKVDNNTTAEMGSMNNTVNITTTEDQMQYDQPNDNIIINVQITSVSDKTTIMPEGNEITIPNNIGTIYIQHNDIEITSQNMDNNMTALSTVKYTSTHKDESTVVQYIKSTTKSLTAEALQQNANVDKQQTEMMIATQEHSTHKASTNVMYTEKPNNNNTATIIHNQILTSLIGIILQHYF